MPYADALCRMPYAVCLVTCAFLIRENLRLSAAIAPLPNQVTRHLVPILLICVAVALREKSFFAEGLRMDRDNCQQREDQKEPRAVD